MQDATPQPTLVLTPMRPAAPANGGTLDVLLRLQAADRPETNVAPVHQPLRLAVVIDRSGSMSGSPLHEALRCAQYIAAGLKPADQLAVVLYDNQVQVPVPLRPGGDPAAVRDALACVESGGNTALFDGWQTGARLLEGGVAGSLSRVLLLSDGQANEGLCDPPEIEKHCAQWAAKGVSTTTVGLGRHFNEDLMIGMARAGAGQHYYGQTAEDLHDSFDEELALLQSLCLRNPRVKLVAGAGVILEPLGLVQQSTPGWYSLPDVAWGAEAWMMVRLHLAPNPSADPRLPHPLLAVVVEAELDEGKPIQPLPGVLALPLVPEADLNGIVEDELVARRLKELQFAEWTAQIRAVAAAGDSKGAEKRMAELQQRVADHPWLLDKVIALKALMQRDAAMSLKEMRYSAYRTSRRQTAKVEAAYQSSETESSEVQAFLRRKPSEGQGRKPRQ